jgi:antitoxin component YwqK of YwqJK toxin-antitoxin module
MKRFMILFLTIFFSFYANAEEKIEYYTNGNIKTRTNYEKGVIDGLQIGYYESGNLKFAASFKNNKLNGLTIGYYENGAVKARDVYVGGILSGEVIAYFENGKIERNETYKNGKKEGLSKIFYDNGQLKSEMVYKNSKVEGIGSLYDKDGNLILKASYKNGELDEILNSTNSNTVGTTVNNTTTNNVASNNANINVNKIDSNIQKSAIDESKINYEDAYITAFNDFIHLLEGKYDDDRDRVQPCAKNGYIASIDNLSEFGYVYHDIDNNGIKELIITNGDSITSIYTLVSGVPKLLLEVNAYRDLIVGITADGFIYRYGSASWANNYHWIEKIENGDTKVYVEEYFTELGDDGKTIKYAKVTPLKTTTINKNEYDTEIAKYAKVSMLDLSYSAIPTKSSDVKTQAKASNSKVSATNNELITLAEYNEIKMGMTHEQIAEIIGGVGTITSETSIAGYTGAVVTYYGSGIGANAMFTFQNGKLIGKAQFGLK